MVRYHTFYDLKRFDRFLSQSPSQVVSVKFRGWRFRRRWLGFSWVGRVDVRVAGSWGVGEGGGCAACLFLQQVLLLQILNIDGLTGGFNFQVVYFQYYGDIPKGSITLYPMFMLAKSSFNFHNIRCSFFIFVRQVHTSWSSSWRKLVLFLQMCILSRKSGTMLVWISNAQVAVQHALRIVFAGL
ncbi:uncharacterized protein LOC125496842 isoform X2 [Beta vulgaris subsp. vulgaris]|uniref:uncharacterized protein LOC125496842 isoform X2 n=1 Tax=Beta vulgaris subsp. vulgaris TaxID=3555 RepID=UPI0025490600|nr:uncharacterized protein LOC125496842 isoform X2 [Beta vulgaris subsp. vulgaris]